MHKCFAHMHIVYDVLWMGRHASTSKPADGLFTAGGEGRLTFVERLR